MNDCKKNSWLWNQTNSWLYLYDKHLFRIFAEYGSQANKDISQTNIGLRQNFGSDDQSFETENIRKTHLSGVWQIVLSEYVGF